MEEAVERGKLPAASFKTPKEQEYVAFLRDAYTSNCENWKYQFAFLAYHMLTMSFAYFNIWHIKQNKPKDFGKGLIGFSYGLCRCSYFTRSRANTSSAEGLTMFLTEPSCKP